jgi:hypothetical protein
MAYLTVFVAPASGETVWYLSNGHQQPIHMSLYEVPDIFTQKPGLQPADF